jgi:endoplasmic reticulum resident protein 44
LDLNSGKLHREFHNGPDPAGIEMMPNVQFEIVLNTDANHVPKVPEVKQVEVRTAPPESAFIKLAPSQERYSVRHGDGGEF